ncbi:MAG: DUF1523 family protein [Paracoccaceae bacterium]
MRYAKWTFWTLLVLFVFSFFHYTLVQHDIVRITNTEIRRIDFGENSIFWASPDVGSDGTTANRDVRFIEAFYENGKPMVFRNEDTGFGWPPYFKLDSSNLQAEARDLVSTKDAPHWVSVSHYGWRNEFLSIYPNAVGVKPVEGPHVRIIPWVNVVILLTLVIVIFMLRRMWLQFRERSIDPVLEDVSDASEAVQDHATGLWARFTGWLGTWRRKQRR